MSSQEVAMSIAEACEATHLTVEPELRAGERFVASDNIFAFRTRPVNLGRWSIIDISVNLPRDPIAVLVQVKFPPNTDLSVSDNFATLVSIATRSLIRVNVWRVDANADPSIDYAFSVMITT
jgi:hypothetical protein